VNAKDVHVLAAASIAGSRFLVTHDRPLIEEVNRVVASLEALTPGDFIQRILPQHPDYASMR
jgi:hypothetical protein